MLEGSLELCRLEALWHRAKAPHLTPHCGEGRREERKDGMMQSWAETHAEPHGDRDPGMMRGRGWGEEKKKKEHLTNVEEKASLPSS